MELILTRKTGNQVLVTCDERTSHTFDLLTLVPGNNGLSHPLDDPVAYGKAIYQAVFPQETAAWNALHTRPERILFVATDDDIDAIPWEYAYGPDDFVVLECHFLRGLPAEQRIAPPTLETGLHIVAIPSNPLSHDVEPLNIEGEWMRLKDIIQHVPYALTLERTRPPTIEQVRTLVANQHHRVIHFMGHGGQDERGAFLCFEKDNGDLDPVTAKQFALRVLGTVFLVTLNACVSATPGATTFGNLAATLVQQRTPYALGMRFSIPDEDARAFSRVFYNDLARSSSVEDALRQARLTLAKGSLPWVVGVPVLYTSLEQPATGFASLVDSPLIREHQPPMEVSALPRAEGIFQGRIDELTVLGTALTGDSRPPVVTIHGVGGQGKTALAREAVERFGYAWPGGVWATSLENLPSRELFVSDLARFLSIETQTVVDPEQVERLVLARLAHRRTLIVLDNAEILVEAVEANNEEARRLAQFLREQLPRPPVSLLATSRSFLGWAGEVGYELTGLTPIEGVRLFEQHAPQREGEIDHTAVWELTEKVEGHPLSLQLLGSAYNGSTLSLSAFVKEYEEALLNAENKYKDLDHRQRTLYTSIETSVRSLDAELADLFSRLWIFHASFLPETAAAIFDPQAEDAEGERSPIYDRLRALWQRSLLTLETAMLRERTIQLYRVLPTMRSYIETYQERVDISEQLLAKFGSAYAQVVSYLYQELNHGSVPAFIAFQSYEDLERGMSYVKGVELGYYLLYWGWILQRLIDTRRGLKLIERALKIGQGQDRQLELQALNKMAAVYHATGQSQRALELHEQALSIAREVGDREGEAITFNYMALVYRATGQPQRALELYEQVLSIAREVGDRDGEVATLIGLAHHYESMQDYGEAQTAFEQSILLSQQITFPAAEVAGMVGLSMLLYQHLSRPQEAIVQMEQAIAVLVETDLPQDAAGQTRDQLQQYLAAMRQGISLDQTISSPTTIPAAQLQVIVANTITVMTTVQERRVEWRESIKNTLQQIQQQEGDCQNEIEFFNAVLALLDGKSTALPENHLYVRALTQIQEGIAADGQEDDETLQYDNLPFDAELIPRSIAALLGRPQEKMAHMQYLTAMSAQTADEGLKALLEVIQLGLFGSDLSQLGQNLSGVYREAWEAIVMGVEIGGVDPRLV
jgi:tetratricopeptide (TPR) repeat protein